LKSKVTDLRKLSLLPDSDKILEGDCTFREATQEICWVEGWDDFPERTRNDTSSPLRDAVFTSNSSESFASERNDDIRAKSFEFIVKSINRLTEKIRWRGALFRVEVEGGEVVVFWAPEADVCDVDFMAINTCFLEELIEQLPRSSDKRTTFKFFLSTWGLTNEDNLRSRWAEGWDDDGAWGH